MGQRSRIADRVEGRGLGFFILLEISYYTGIDHPTKQRASSVHPVNRRVQTDLNGKQKGHILCAYILVLLWTEF